MGFESATATIRVLLLAFPLVLSSVPGLLMARDAGVSGRPLAPDYRIHADGLVTGRLCFNGSCATRQSLTFDASDMAGVARQMALCPGEALHDRVQRARIGIWQMELLAEHYQPLLANDQGTNDRDQTHEGRMDCIDNTSNTTTYLNVLHDLGLLPGWRMAPPEVRDRTSMEVHWTAVAVDAQDGRSWAVDSWFRANGHLPFIMPLADWVRGRTAWLPPSSDWNPFPRYSNQLCGA